MVMKYTAVFLIGFLSCAVLFYGLSYSNVEVPFATGLVSLNTESPSDWVDEDDIILFGDHIELRIANATLSNYAPTGSMKPLFDKGANGIRVRPSRAEDISIGDIISFQQNGVMIVHRVVEAGEDSEGIYFVTQGDNNIISDGKVMFKDIEWVTVGVIW